MSGKQPVTGGSARGLAGAGHPSTDSKDLGTGTDAMTGVVGDDGNPVKAADLPARETARTRRASLIPAITKDTDEAALRDIINMLRIKITDLEATAPAVATTGGGHVKSTIKLNPPPKFDGTKKEELQGFLTQVRANLAFSKTTDTIEQVLYAASYLTGKALEWFQPTQADYLGHNLWSEMHLETQQIFSDFEYFESAISQVFGLADKVRTAKTKLNELRQTKSAATYSAEFRQLAFRVDWNDEGLKYQFFRGLKSDVKYELIKIDRKSKSLDEYMNEAIVIDNRLFERKKEKGPGDSRPAPTLAATVTSAAATVTTTAHAAPHTALTPVPWTLTQSITAKEAPARTRSASNATNLDTLHATAAVEATIAVRDREAGSRSLPSPPTPSARAKARADHDFANALAALVDDEPPRTICMIDYENEPTDDYTTIEEYDQYEQYERNHYERASESNDEDYIRDGDINKENKRPRGYTPLAARLRNQSVPPMQQTR